MRQQDVVVILALAVALAVASSAAPTVAAAQQEPPRVQPSTADAAISAGRLDVAEELLYAASRRAPRDAAARGALGAFLAARGQLRVGAVLLEEARQFGADPRVVDARLATIFSWLGAWGELAALSHAVPSAAERARARWLASLKVEAEGPDSVRVMLEPNDVTGVGRFRLFIGDSAIVADIDPSIDGLLLPSSVAVWANAQSFGADVPVVGTGAAASEGTTGVLAVVSTVRIGALTLHNIPVRLSGTGPAARVGLSVLAPFVPTINLAARTLTLRQNGVAPAGERVPLFLTFPGVSVVARAGRGPAPLVAAEGRAAVRGRAWTLDVAHGVVVIEP